MPVRRARSPRRPAASARWARLRGPDAPSLRRRAAEPALLLPVRKQCRTPGRPLPHLARPRRQTGRPAGGTEARWRAGARVACPCQLLSCPSGVTCVGEAAVPSCAAQEGGSASPATVFSMLRGPVSGACWALVCDSRGSRLPLLLPSFPLLLPRAVQLCPGHSALYLAKL